MLPTPFILHIPDPRDGASRFFQFLRAPQPVEQRREGVAEGLGVSVSHKTKV